MVKLRKAKRSDWDFILALRNEFYEFFYKQDRPLTKKEHYKYMRKQSKNPKFHHWVITHNKMNVGYTRILDQDIGIMVKKEFQNMGFASKALRLIEKEAVKFGINKIVALVLKKNPSSKKIFIKNNYSLKMYWLEKDLRNS